MFLAEMFMDQNSEYQDLSKDQSQVKITDLRKTRLTLAQINQLRKMNDQRNVEKNENLMKIRKIYAQPTQPTA